MTSCSSSPPAASERMSDDSALRAVFDKFCAFGAGKEIVTDMDNAKVRLRDESPVSEGFARAVDLPY